MQPKIIEERSKIAPDLNIETKKPPEKGGFFSVSVEGLELVN